VIVANNQPGNPFNMGGNLASINIPSVMISQSDGVLLKNALAAGDSVSVAIGGANAPSNLRDGDFDNGIIAHEYTHGISIRLTNGPSSAGCLFNAEAMGEGWSDWFALMMDFDPNRRDRGIGTFATNEPITGGGIRPARYSPDLNVNPFTYGDVNNTGAISQPHGIGFIWATMLWDLTLVMVDSFGHDPDLINGTGGNNMVMALVTEGLKLQPCNPGFVDGRDAILQADVDLYGGVHQCLIWEVFARRGLGFSASQGSSASRTDQVEAFDLPTSCQTPTAAPISLWSFTAGQGCGDKVFFNDESTDVPQSYFWDFGDGNTDSVANPVHTYNANGVYLITHVVTNTIGSDTSYKVVNISLPPGPAINDQEICLDNGATVLAPVDSGLFIWYDVAGNVLDTAASLSFPNLTADTMVMVQEIIEAPTQQVGPATAGNVGGGGYHNTGFTGTVNFEAFSGFTLISVWVDAGSSGSRTISLWDGPDGSGQIIDQVTVNIPQGPGRVTLGLEIPEAGNYSVGGSSIDLYRNNSGANYPYDIAGLVSLTGSPAGPDFYYYLYDWEVKGEDCRTDQVPAEIRVKSADFSSVQDSFTSTFNFTDLSVGASDWLWDFGDSTTSTAQNPIHTYSNPGTYLVTLMIDGLCVFSDSVEAVRLTGVVDLPLGVRVSLTPNPTKSSTKISFSESIKEPVRVTVLSMKGQVINEMLIPAGANEQALSLQGYSPGVYLIELRNERSVESLRLVVQP
ncbi:MAG: M36 family metallopeptidase, partial [Bacteroidota bacterium]